MVDIRLLINQLLDHCLATHCLLCQSELTKQEVGQSAPFCQHCWSSLPWLGPHCQRCAMPMPETSELVCGHCQTQPPPWHHAHALFRYHQPVSNLIQEYKYRQRFHVGAGLGKLWLQQLQHLPMLAETDAVIPVPLHWRRQWHRGYNQVIDLFRPVSATLGLSFQPAILKRVRPTRKQAGKNRKIRLHNLRDAFACDAGRVKGKSLLLVDDVMTTGATLHAAARCLLDAGAHHVNVLVLARTTTD